MDAEHTVTPVRYPVFADGKGNRFVFPGLYSDDEKTAGWGFCRQIEAALGVTEEEQTFDVMPDDNGVMNFPHVVAEAGSRGFAHGHNTVWLIGGPTFDGIVAEESALSRSEA